MWQPDIRDIVQVPLRGGVAPSTYKLALQVYVQRTSAQRARDRGTTGSNGVFAVLRRFLARFTKTADQPAA